MRLTHNQTLGLSGLPVFHNEAEATGCGRPLATVHHTSCDEVDLWKSVINSASTQKPDSHISTWRRPSHDSHACKNLGTENIRQPTRFAHTLQGLFLGTALNNLTDLEDDLDPSASNNRDLVLCGGSWSVLYVYYAIADALSVSCGY